METIARSIADTIVKRGIRPQSMHDRCLYGAHAFLSNALTTLVMFLVAVLFRMIPEFLIYMAAYWIIHSVADAFHCDRYYKCLLMSTGMFTALAMFCLFTNAPTRHVFSWMLFLVTVGVFIFQLLDVDTQPAFTTKRLIVYAVSVFVALILNCASLVTVSLPFTYGMCTITILQAKVRRQEQ